MNAIIHPRKLRGQAKIPSSKSYAHRLLIAAALSDAPTQVQMNALNNDITATVDCLRTLGAKIIRTESGFTVHPIGTVSAGDHTLFCGESGSTLRFMIPVAAVLSATCTFIFQQTTKRGKWTQLG